MRIAALALVVELVLSGSAFGQNFKSQISGGYGTSFGGVGGTYQYNMNGTFALEGGLGYYPPSSFLPGIIAVQVGAKRYFSRQTVRSAFAPFLELEFGSLGQAGTQQTYSSYYGSGAYAGSYTVNDVSALYGPSILVGTELYFVGGQVGITADAGTSYNIAPNPLNTRVLFGFDFGLTVGV